MKVFTYLALLGGAAAVRLMSHHAIARQPTQMHKVLVQLNQSEDWPELDEEQMQEIEDWVRSEMGEDGSGTITKDEAHHALQNFADTHGFEVTDEMWEEANDAFDWADTNGDGELDLGEIMDAVEEHHGSDGEGSGPDGEHDGGKHKKGKKGGKKGHKDIQIKKALVQLKQSEDWPELDSDQEDEIEAWVREEIGEDGKGTITKKEAKDALTHFAEKHGFEITAEMWKEAEMAFDYVDTNGDGELDLKEIMKVVEEHGGKKDGKKGGKGKKLIQMKKVFAQIKQSEDWPELDSDQEDEIEAWVREEIGEDGKGTITKKEAKDALAAFAKKHGFKITKEMWKEAEMAFNYVDTNGDGQLDLKEIMKVVEEHGGKDHKLIQMKKVLVQLRQSEDWPELTEEQEDEIEEWVKSEIGEDGSGTITKQEAADALSGFAAKHGFEITDEMWKEAEMAFDYVDTNGDGQLDLDEILKVVEEHGDHGDKGKKGKGKKGKGKKGKGKKGKE